MSEKPYVSFPLFRAKFNRQKPQTRAMKRSAASHGISLRFSPDKLHRPHVIVSIFVSILIFWTFFSTAGAEGSKLFQCKKSSGLNVEHQFHCCYTDRQPGCSNLCIENSRVCDGVPDCPDSRDEWSSLCSQPCVLGYHQFKGFACRKTWKRCLTFNFYCDEEVDCGSEQEKDESDEAECDCFSNRDCPFFGNISVTIPPKIEDAVDDDDSDDERVVLVAVVCIIVVLVLVVVGICAFLVKRQLSKSFLAGKREGRGNNVNNQGGLISNVNLPTPIFASPSRTPQPSPFRTPATPTTPSAPSIREDSLSSPFGSLALGEELLGPTTIDAPPSYEEIVELSRSASRVS